MDKAVFETALAEIIEVPNEGADRFKNPYLTVAKFIFADDKGAPTSTAIDGNLQGIEASDFDDVIKSAIDMPVKMKFTGAGAANHLGSYVIGHITSMDKVQAEDGTNQLIASAALYAEEYPEEIEYLKESFDKKEAPGISYEMAFSDSIIKNGVQWLKNVITCAATFVRSPAYGNRTALLALASAKNDSELLETMKTFIAQAEGDSGIINPNNKGGINVDELEKAKQELETLKAEAATKTSEITRLGDEITQRDTTIGELTEKVSTLERERTIESRVRKFTEAGFTLEADAEKADKKKTFWLGLSDEAFDEYLSDLVTAKKASASTNPGAPVALASLNTGLPRLQPDEDVEPISFRFRD
jgi:hypothetical protein